MEKGGTADQSCVSQPSFIFILFFYFWGKAVKMKLPSALLWCLIVHGASGVSTDGLSVSVMEGDSVTLNTGVKTNQQDKILWYYNGIRIALITGDQSKTCTAVQCNEDTERFRDRLKLDHQTGSLTIKNTRNTDSGEYTLKISRGSSDSEKFFNVTVTGVSAAERNEMKRKTVKEEEYVTLVPGLRKKPNYLFTWYFHDTLIAEITGDQSKICTDVQCDERFRDRLKLDHQTGSLNITNTRNTDSGEYTVQINSSRFSILKTFSVTVPDSGPSSAVRTGISAAVVVLLLVTVGVIYYCHRRSRKRKARQIGNGTVNNNNHQENVTEETALNHTGSPPEAVANGTSHKEPESAMREHR
ncbi:uncharacterized protein LOC143735226 [Siphateles boraxobius]|uniref:uncharacterized protein LOC143735226 n=1 Tax=Siphateles boraxobius TaxID=180520 RepID=UPI004062E36B